MKARPMFAALIALAAVACGTRYEARPAPALSKVVTDRGDLVYVGTVFPLETPAAQPTYVYERRVDESEGAIVSTHVTRDRSGVIQLAEAATHSADYALAEYTLYANQLGQSGSIVVDGDTVTFKITDDDGER